MPKEDYLLKYIEKLSRVIAALLGLKESGKTEEIIRIANETYSEAITVSIQEILEMNDSDFSELIEKNTLNISHLEKLCELSIIVVDTLYETGNYDDMKKLAGKTLLLYRKLSEKDKTFSFERETIITDLENIINS